MPLTSHHFKKSPKQNRWEWTCDECNALFITVTRHMPAGWLKMYRRPVWFCGPDCRHDFLRREREKRKSERAELKAHREKYGTRT